MFSEKATKIDEIFTVNLTLCSRHQIDGEDFVNFHGLLRKYELYVCSLHSNTQFKKQNCSKLQFYKHTYIFFQKLFSEWKPYMVNMFFKN